MPSVFADSTTLTYPLDLGETIKQAAASAWLKRLTTENLLVMSPQVLNETYWAASRKPHLATAEDKLRAYLEDFLPWTTAPLTAEVTIAAWALKDRYRVGFWDALVLTSANEAGCDIFLSEDLSDGEIYGRVKVVNPFAHTPESILGTAPFA